MSYRQQQEDEQRRREAGLSYELPFNHGHKWIDMGEYEIEEFMRWHPTYCMSAEQASDWCAGVERNIRRDQERRLTGRVAGEGWTYREVNIGSSDHPRIEQVSI